MKTAIYNEHDVEVVAEGTVWNMIEEYPEEGGEYIREYLDYYMYYPNEDVEVVVVRSALTGGMVMVDADTVYTEEDMIAEAQAEAVAA